MINLVNALQISAAALCSAAPCSACPPEAESGAVGVRIQELSELPANITVARQLLRADAPATALAPRLVFAAADGGQDTVSVVKVVIKNDNGELEYADENGTITATHNGQAIPPDRIQREGGVVRILGKDGGTLYEFHIARPSPGGVIRVGEGGLWRAVGWDGDTLYSTAAPARGRIGVYLGPTNESLRSEYGIENESAVTINGTIEGSPAEEAGLQANDIVVRINGQTASEDSLRSIIGETEPGHVVTLRIVRGGEPRDVKVRVGASEEVQFDQTFEGMQVEPGMTGHEFTIELDDLHGRIGDVQKHLLELAPDDAWREHLDHLQQFNPEMLQKLHEKFGEGQQFLELHVQPFIHGRQQWLEHAGPHSEAVREKVLEALKNAQLNLDDETRVRIHEAVTKALENAMSNLHNVDVQLHETDAPVLFDLMEKGEGDHIMVLPEGGRFRMMQPADIKVEAVPGVPGAGGDASERLRRLEERLEKLEALLQQLVERQGGGGARLP